VVYFKGTGIVEIDKTNLSPVHGGEITSLQVMAGDTVKKGELLATIKPSKNCIKKNNTIEYKLKHDLSLLKFRKDSLEKQVNQISTEHNTYLQRALEVELSESHLYPTHNKNLKKLELSLENLNAEIAIKTNYLKQIKVYNIPITSSNCANEYLKTPFSGLVYAVSAKENEFAHRGKPLITLVDKNKQVRIEAYLSNDYLEYLYVGKEISIQFPDKKQSRGIIKKIESNATLASERKWQGYDPVKTRVRATITPLSSASHQNWGNYDRMLVEIKGVK